MKTTEESRTLTVIETADQAKWFAQYSSFSKAHDLILVSTPEAAYACQKLGQTYIKIEDYANVVKRLSEYETVLSGYLEWEDWLNNWAQEAIPEFGRAGFKPARGATFLLQLLFAEIWATATNLHELLESIRPNRVALWPPVITHIPWHLQPSISPITFLMPVIARNRGIDVIDLSEQAPHLTPTTKVGKSSRFRSTLRWVRYQMRQSAVFSELESVWTTGLLTYLKQLSPNSSRILMSGFGYELSLLAHEFHKRGVHILQIPDELPPPRLVSQVPPLPADLMYALVAASSRLLEEPALWSPLEKWGVDRTLLWSLPIHFWWLQIVPELWLQFQYAQRLFRRHKITALVTWDTGGSTLGSAVSNASLSAKVPRYIYQHGGSSGLDAKILQMFLRQSDVLLVYGQGSAEELQATRPSFLQPCAQVIPVGSGRLDDLQRYQKDSIKINNLRTRLRHGDSRPLILYIPTCFGTYGRAISDLAGYPDVSYFELQQKILLLWRENPNVRLLYKSFFVANDSQSHVMPDFIREHIPGALVTNHRLTDLMWSVDAIVVDHAITALSEVLLTRKRLVVYMPQPSVVNPESKTLLQKRAAIAEMPDEFVTHVRTLLQADDYHELGNPDDTFLRAYCTYRNDGHSVERAAAVILQSANRSG